MPRRETRESIESALGVGRRMRGLASSKRWRESAIVQHLAKLRDVLDSLAFAKVQSQFLSGSHRLSVEVRRKRRRPDDGGMPALVEPPRGPKPLQGGAAASLEFGD